MLQKNKKKKLFFYVLYSDKIWVFDQSERTQVAVYNAKYATRKIS